MDANAGRPWLQEDYINLLELMEEGSNWNLAAAILGRSVSACKIAYGRMRLVSRLSIFGIREIREKTRMKPIRS